MTIYGRYNKTTSSLEIRSDGAYSSGEWQFLAKCKNASEAYKEFVKHKTTYWPRWTSKIKWEGIVN